MKIAVFNSRKEKLCENKEISWEAFCHKVSQTKRTSETMVEYDSFPKEKQDDICNVLQEWESILTENITEEERDTLINILKKICLNKNKKIGGLNE